MELRCACYGPLQNDTISDNDGRGDRGAARWLDCPYRLCAVVVDYKRAPALRICGHLRLGLRIQNDADMGETAFWRRDLVKRANRTLFAGNTRQASYSADEPVHIVMRRKRQAF